MFELIQLIFLNLFETVRILLYSIHMMTRSHKIYLKPNKAQEIALTKTAGTARFTYNWALATWDKWYKDFKNGLITIRPNKFELSKLWTKTKPVWASETCYCSQQRAILNLGKAFENFWNKTTKKPVFKKKNIRDSFYVVNSHFKVVGKHIKLPKIGSVKMTEKLRFTGKIMSCTVSREAGRWYVSIQVETPSKINLNTSVVGVDVGISKLAIASDKTVCKNPKSRELNQKIKSLQKVLSRKSPKSRNKEKVLIKLQKAYKKIVNRRDDNIHKFTTKLAKNHGEAVVETLIVNNMKQTARWLRCLLQETAMKEVHRQLEYKMNSVIHAPQYYPSSKTCSKCNWYQKDLSLSDRVYACQQCGLKIDRDLNAALNLKNMRWVAP